MPKILICIDGDKAQAGSLGFFFWFGGVEDSAINVIYNTKIGKISVMKQYLLALFSVHKQEEKKE